MSTDKLGGACIKCGSLNGAEHEKHCPLYPIFPVLKREMICACGALNENGHSHWCPNNQESSDKKEKPFMEIFRQRVNKCKEILEAKETEYAKGANRYHNFDKAAIRLDCTPEKALEGMMIKHFVSVQDIINNAENIHHLPSGVLDEKITDTINYLILLEGMLLRRLNE